MSHPAPFRWNLARRQRLGSLLEGPRAEAYRGFRDDLRACCVRVAAAAADGGMVFVGLSPESIYDHLSGVLAETSWAERIALLNFSMRHGNARDVAQGHPEGLRALRGQMTALGLSPAQIATAERPTIFVDLVYSGGTLGNLLELLERWGREGGIHPDAVRRRIRFLGITEQEKNSPNTWRWYQRAAWAQRMPRRALRSVSIPYRLWVYLGDFQKKVARWHPPMVWGAEEWMHPPRDADSLEALRLAWFIHERARTPRERERFAAALAERPEMREPAVRRMVLELRGTRGER
ncbi:MAG TPA: hypothetical protein VFQ45_17150 [Longimicrobium sp.]|nr:hypothetical protein [Longimicrobium sp.]